MTAAVGPVEARVLDELAATAGITAAIVQRPGAPTPLRVLRGRRAGKGDKLVVLLHGRGHAASVWFPLLPALAARHPLVALDLPGFGASADGPAPGARGGADAASAFFVDPIEAFLRQEVAQTGAAWLALAGHSLGGLVALELALRGRVPVLGLMLFNPMGLGPEVTVAARAFFRLHPERLARLLGQRGFEALNPPPPTPLGRRVADLEHELLTAAPRTAAARAFDRLCPLAGPAFHRRDRLAELAMDVAVDWGERDRAFPVANALGAVPLIRKGGVARHPELGHSPHLEAPEAMLPRILAFL